MEYFVIQLLTGKEESFLKYAKNSLSEENIRFFWLRRELFIKKLGKMKKSVSSIFPGYIFIESEDISYDFYKKIRRFPGFCRFLRNNDDIRALPHDDKRLVYQLSSNGEIAGISRVYFNEDDRIRVISGPMKGLEGEIAKVDKRKKRAKIRLKLYENSFLIDFGFELIEHFEE
ncbi:MAG: antiterminator LoaP [Spirochaetes bacterium]|nr:antiterminator LoaP [Spirochaetota bacterium]